MRISIRQQLALLLVLSSVVGLAALAIATWITNHNFVLNVTSARLRTTAVLKAAQIAFNLELMHTAATFLTTRSTIQTALARYNDGSNTTAQNWFDAAAGLEATLGTVGPLNNPLVLQARIFSRNVSGPAGPTSVLNSTGTGINVQLPWLDPQGNPVFLGDSQYGYPSALYPNLTISDTGSGATSGHSATYNGQSLGPGSTLILGPLSVNKSFALLSLTLPIVNKDAAHDDVLGWATVVTDARLIRLVQQDQRGLGDTGQTLLIGPTNTTNHFSKDIIGSEELASQADVQYLMPLNTTAASRHPNRTAGAPNPPFKAGAYPAVVSAIVEDNRGVDDVNSMLRTHNEAGHSVSVSYSVPPTTLVDWIVVVEQAKSEVWKPINDLRTIILACLLAVMGFWLLVSFPLAHWAVLPIIRLRAATEQTTDPPNGAGSPDNVRSCKTGDAKSAHSSRVHERRAGLVETIIRWRGHRRGGLRIESRDDHRFRIPGKVPEKKNYWIHDEMTDLITTFNEMTDELYLQYSKLEERVRQRTIELEHSKKAAEAANESKTLFVANVSHELKTPLNGILGMCAVCMEESDPNKLKQSLAIIFKSGDLLLRTLTDLLTFSTNQVGRQVLKLDEKEFYLRDLESQVFAIFAEQAKDRKIHLSVIFEETPMERFSSPDEAPLKDTPLFGDVHRLLQIVINFTSNALKFTPADGSVTLTIRALKEEPPRRQSIDGKPVRFSPGHKSLDSQPAASPNPRGTANFINPQDLPHERSESPPPGYDIYIELEVKDTGPGIPDEHKRTIFEPFVQGDAGLSRKHSGTGLGLSICSQLASLMRGAIRLRSQLGAGSTFAVKIPLRRVTGRKSARSSLSRKSPHEVIVREGPQNLRVPTMASMTAQHYMFPPTPPIVNVSPAPIESASISGSPSAQAKTISKAGKEVKASKEAKYDFSKVRILVAEDNQVNQQVIVKMLELEKIFDVTIAGDGQMALDLVKTNSNPSERTNSSTGDDSSTLVEDSSTSSMSPRVPFDLIFMDVQMPNMDGLTSTKLIRQYGYSGPIVALTAYAEQNNIEGCYQAGMDFFLAKPIKRPLLRKVLTEYCAPAPDDVDESGGSASRHIATDSQSTIGFDRKDAHSEPPSPFETKETREGTQLTHLENNPLQVQDPTFRAGSLAV
ncbi:hypothetical protein BST61_g2457 [Cercospora zeina]